MCVCVCQLILTVILDRSTVHAAAESRLLTERRRPASIAVAVPITVTHLHTTHVWVTGLVGTFHWLHSFPTPKHSLGMKFEFLSVALLSLSAQTQRQLLLMRTVQSFFWLVHTNHKCNNNNVFFSRRRWADLLSLCGLFMLGLDK